MSTYQPDDKRVRQMAWEIAHEESARGAWLREKERQEPKL